MKGVGDRVAKGEVLVAVEAAETLRRYEIRSPVSGTILSRDAFLSFVRTNPDVALEMLSALTDRLRRTDELLRSRVSRNANEEEKARLK